MWHNALNLRGYSGNHLWLPYSYHEVTGDLLEVLPSQATGQAEKPITEDFIMAGRKGFLTDEAAKKVLGDGELDSFYYHNEGKIFYKFYPFCPKKNKRSDACVMFAIAQLLTPSSAQIIRNSVNALRGLII